MAANSKIEWTDHTVNFWIGCTKVSPACDHCYAERDWSMTGRYQRVEWGPHGARSPTKNPLGQVRSIAAGAAKRGRRERVFVNSLSDWADNHKSIAPEWRAQIFEAARLYPGLDFLLLTKRPQNIAGYLPADWGGGYPNVWLGTTAENQEEADRRVKHLLATPAAVRFVSAEPLLGPVDFAEIKNDGPRLDWIIVGGESGSGARPMHPDWPRAIRDQCAAAGVPFFLKQWGEWAPGSLADHILVGEGCISRGFDQSGRRAWAGKGQAGAVRLDRVGKARAGRDLDGRTHDDMPALEGPEKSEKEATE